MVTLDRDDILAALDELVEVLVAAGARTHIRVVGGAAIAVRFTRDATTTDVDPSTAPLPKLRPPLATSPGGEAGPTTG